MIAEELISFRKHFWPSRFPIEARVYEFGSFGPSRTLITHSIASLEALAAFQAELTRRESADEWRFIAYYEPIVPWTLAPK